MTLTAAAAPPQTCPPAPSALVLAGAPVSAQDRSDLADLHRDRPRASRATPTPTVVAVAAPHGPAHRLARAGRTRHDARLPLGLPDLGRVGIVLGFALGQVGDAYRFGAAGPGVYDCSGLVLAAFARVGVGLPHSTGGIIHVGRAVARAQLAPGDVVFPTAGHVALYLGGGRIVEAANPRAGVRVGPLWGFWAARRIL